MLISNLKNLFISNNKNKLKKDEIEIPKFILDKMGKDSDDNSEIESYTVKCLNCNSDKVGEMIISDQLKGIKRENSNDHIGCIKVTLGKTVKICEDCKHKWDEKIIKSPMWVNFG